MAENVGKRLESLDVLRGLDIFILVCFQPVLFWLLSHSCFGDGAAAEFFKTQLTHCQWEGFRFWDLIMPLFLFMSGASIPFSLGKYDTSAASYIRILRRVFLLFVFGMVVQGGLLTFNPDRFKFYSNTLQSIAVGYLITALVFLNFKTKGRIFSGGTDICRRLGVDDVRGRFHAGRQLCRKGRQAFDGAFSRRC